MISNTKVFGYSLDKDMDKIFFDEYGMYSPFYTKFMDIGPAPSGNHYTESELSPLGGIKEVPEGQGIQFDTPVQGHSKTVYYTAYGLGFQITRQMYEDDLFKNFKKMPKKLGKSANVKLEVESARIFNDGFATEKAWDDKYVFATDHTTMKGLNTIANEPTTGSALSVTSLQAAFEYFKSRSLTDEAGNFLMFRPSIMMIPPELEHLAYTLLKTLGYVGTMNNDINTLNPANGVVPSVELIINPYLTDVNAFFLLAKEGKPKFMWKNAVEFTSADDFYTGNALFKVWTRFVSFVMDYKPMYGNPGN